MWTTSVSYGAVPASGDKGSPSIFLAVEQIRSPSQRTPFSLTDSDHWRIALKCSGTSAPIFLQLLQRIESTGGFGFNLRSLTRLGWENTPVYLTVSYTHLRAHET